MVVGLVTGGFLVGVAERDAKADSTKILSSATVFQVVNGETSVATCLLTNVDDRAVVADIVLRGQNTVAVLSDLNQTIMPGHSFKGPSLAFSAADAGLRCEIALTVGKRDDVRAGMQVNDATTASGGLASFWPAS